MSKKGDFLSGFSGGNTQKPLTEQNLTPAKGTDPVDIAKNKRLADKIVADAEKKENASKTAGRSASAGAATRPAQSASAIIKAPEQVVTKDEKFHKRKIVRYGIIGIVVIVIAIIIFLIVRMTNRVEVPNWVGSDIEEATTWELLNRVTVETERAYSLEFDEDIIISQNREPRSNMSRGSVIILTVSRGPDMNEEIDLPDFEEMIRGQIRTWADEHLVRGIVYREENSTDVEENHVIRVEFPSAVDPDHFLRSDTVTIYISTGPETVQITNLVGNDREEVDEFIIENPGLNVEFEYEPHETIEQGTVLAQDPSPGTRMPTGETLTLTLSAGSPVVVPNFADMRRIEAIEMMNDPEAELDVVVHRRWNTSIPNGRFVSQSVDPGEEVYGDSPPVIVVYSEGRPWIPDLRDTSLRDLESTIIDINDKGSSITIGIAYVNSYLPRGLIVSQTVHNQFVPLDAHVVFHISLENLEPPPDYVPPDDPGVNDPGGGDDPGDDGGGGNDDDDWDFGDDF